LVYGGAQTLVPGTTINVSATGAIAESEMSLVANPTNPLNLVGFSHRLTTPILVDVYSSSDGGATWSTNTINNADDSFGTTGNRFDPAVGFDANGVCYIVYGHREPGTPNRTRLIGARSTDGGLNFGNYRTIDIQNDRGTSPGLDKWYIHSGLDPASGNQAMYVGWVHFAVEGAGGTVNDDRIMFAGTRDAGNTWTAPLLLNDPAATGAETGPTYASPVVGRNGEVAVTWHDMGDNTIMLDRDLDGLWGGPATFGTDITVRTGINLTGRSLLPPAQPERGVNAAPMLEVWRNTNWLLETHVEQFGTGNDLDIWVGISQNFGETWSFQRVEGATSTDFNPWLQVDQRTGAFHVLYLSTDGDASGNDDIRPKIATSFDAGSTWQRGFLSTQTSNEAGGYTGDYLEYHGLAARDGTVHGLWPSRYGGGGQDLDAFTANAAYVSNISDNRLVIGETGGADDDYLVRLAPNNSAFLEVFVDGVREFTGLRQSINSIIFNPGGGTNSFSIASIPGLSALTINGTNNADIIRIDALGANLPTLNMVLAAGDDTVTLGQDLTSFLTINSPVNISGQDGSDTLNYGNGSASAIATNVSFDGGGGGFLDTVDVNDGAMTSIVEYDIGPISMVRNAFGSLSTLNHSNLEDIEIFAGSGGDQFTVRNNLGPVTRCFGNSGNDNFIFGDGLLSPSSGAVFNAGPGTDTLTFDDRNNPSGRFWDVFNDRVIYAGIVVFITAGFEGVTVLAGNGGDNINFANQTFSQVITFDAGGGNDLVNTNTSIVPNLTLRGGAGNSDNIFMDDRNFPSGGQAFATIHSDRIHRFYPVAIMQSNYDDFEGINYWMPQSVNEAQIFGISNDVPGFNSFQIHGNSLADTFLVYPSPATPNIPGPLYLIGNGGADLAALVDDGSTPGTYTFLNPVGGAAFIYGSFVSGPGYVGADSTIETLNVYGGNGGDTFNVDQFQSGQALAIFGRGGDDACRLGNGDMSLNLTSAAAFSFDGGANADRFTIANGATNVAWTYQVNNNQLVANKSAGGYIWQSNTQNIESQYVFAGPLADNFAIDATAPGLYTEFNGAGGYDACRVGPGLATVDGIRGRVNFIAGADAGFVTVSDYNLSGSPVIVHLDANSIGAYAGDNMFGIGGSLTFSGLTNNPITGAPGLDITLKSDSTIYAQPLASTKVNVVSGFTFFEGPSGSIKLATAGLVNPVINGNSNSGNLTSSNRQTLSWFNFIGEIDTDPISPAVIDGVINVNGIPGFAESGNDQAVDVRFTENVSGLISPASLQLTNLTTAQTIPTANIAVAYDLATNTAHFTFPGYPFGALPDGDYSGKIFAGLPDFFGNPLPADASFSFFFMQGDANLDRRVDSDDFNILATSFGLSGRTFSQGDFNYDGTVNSDDFNILAGKFGQSVAPSMFRGTVIGAPTKRLIDELSAQLIA